MKKVLGYTVTFLAGSLLSGTVAMAATTMVVQAQKNNSVIEFNGQQVSAPPSLVYDGSTYVQLYSIQQGFKQFYGVKPTWDGHTFNVLTQQPSSSSSSSSSSTKLGPFVFSKISMQVDSIGIEHVYGLVKNTDTSAHGCFVTITFFDTSGNIMGTATTVISGLGAGESETFDAMADSDYSSASTYTIQIDSVT